MLFNLLSHFVWPSNSYFTQFVCAFKFVCHILYDPSNCMSHLYDPSNLYVTFCMTLPIVCHILYDSSNCMSHLYGPSLNSPWSIVVCASPSSPLLCLDRRWSDALFRGRKPWTYRTILYLHMHPICLFLPVHTFVYFIPYTYIICLYFDRIASFCLLFFLIQT